MEVEYPQKLKKITIRWENLGLQDTEFDVWMYTNGQRTDMILPASRQLPRLYELNLNGTKPLRTKTSFLICSENRNVDIEISNPCP